MTSDTPPAPKTRGWGRLLIVFIVAFDVAAFFQWADGAFQSEFGAHPDEGGHYLAGVRWHEALARDGWAALKGKPGFDLALGAWMFVGGTSRLAVIFFLAALAAGSATLIFATVRREFGGWAAAVAALLWLGTPAVREAYEVILPGLGSAFLLTAGALLWAWMMDAGGGRGVALSKWIGLAARLGAGCVLVFVLAIAMKIVPGDSRAAWIIWQECISVPGLAVAAFAFAGIVLRPRSEAAGAVWTALATLVAGVLFARWMQAANLDSRALIAATPALVMFAVRGTVALGNIIGARTASAAAPPRRAALWVLLLVLLALPPDLLSPWQKNWHGGNAAALALLAESPGPARILVVSDARGEGMFLAEVAMHDHEGKFTIERGSETLTEPTNAFAHDPGQRFLEDEQLLAHLTAGRIGYILLDSAVPHENRAGYHEQVLRVLEGHVRSFWPILDSPIIRDGEPQGHPLRIFRVIPPAGAELP